MELLRLKESEPGFSEKFMRPVLNVRVPACFPARADDYLEERINLNE